METERLISVREAADLLGLKAATIYKYKMVGSIPFIKLGSRVLFSPARLRSWVAEHAREPVGAKA
jgi:excisionase family DNA binding protein